MGRRSFVAGCAVGCLLFGHAVAQDNITNDTFFCRYSCGTGIVNGCYDGVEACLPEPGCITTGAAPFHNLEVCSQFLAAKPSCDTKTLECVDAPDFQLAYDMNCDLRLSYDVGDWLGLAVVIAPDAVAFTPGGVQIALGQEAVVAAIADFRTKSKLLKITPTVGQVLLVNGVIHAVGTLTTGVKSYVRWVQDPAGKDWFLGSIVFGSPAAFEGVKAATSAGDAIFDAIKSREEFLVKMYNAKDYDSLLAVYDKETALIPSDGSKGMAKDVAAAYLKTRPWGDQANMFPTIVTEALDGKTVHEVGYSDSVRGGYYALWVWGADYNVWRIQVQCFFGFPHNPEDSAILVA